MAHRLQRYFEFGPTQHDAFDDLLNKTHVAIMVIVVQPHCPHCDALKPHLLKLKKSLEPDEDKSKVVILDSAATEASKSSAVKGITGVPTIRGVFKKKHIREHNGPRDSEALEQFLSSLDEETGSQTQEGGRSRYRRRTKHSRHRRRHKSRRHKSRRHKSRRHKSRMHKRRNSKKYR